MHSVKFICFFFNLSLNLSLAIALGAFGSFVMHMAAFWAFWFICHGKGNNK